MYIWNWLSLAGRGAAHGSRQGELGAPRPIYQGSCVHPLLPISTLSQTIMDGVKGSVDKSDEFFVRQLERQTLSLEEDDDGALLGDLRPDAERKLVRKLDNRLLPTIVVIFIMNYIDVCARHLSYCAVVSGIPSRLSRPLTAHSRHISSPERPRERLASNR